MKTKKNTKTHSLILVSALIFGAILGGIFHSAQDSSVLQFISTNIFGPVGQIFLRLIFMVVVPLVFSALVLGVYELGQAQGLGRIAGKTLSFTVLASASSVIIGIVLVNTLKPGLGFNRSEINLGDQAASIATIQKNAESSAPFHQILVDLIPKNPIETASKALAGEMIPFMVFALIFGMALVLVDKKQKFREDSGSSKSPLIHFFEHLFSVSMQIIEFAMKLAPLAVFCIIFNTVFKMGLGVLQSVLYFTAVVVAGLLIQQFVVYTFLLKAFTKQKPFEFFKNCREVYLYAFSTASSNATLPLALETAEERLKLPPRISRFVLTVGSTANQNGTALFEGVTVLFLAQVYGVDLSLGQQITVVIMSILAGVGTAGVPGGSLPLIMILLQQMGIPAEGIGLILGADRFLDMCRTTLNVSGDLVMSALVSEGETA